MKIRPIPIDYIGAKELWVIQTGIAPVQKVSRVDAMKMFPTAKTTPTT